MPRFLVLVKASPKGEDFRPPPAETTALFEGMGRLNEEMLAAAVLLGGEGLCPSSRDGYRVHFSKDSPDSDSPRVEVEKGPFDASAGTLVCGWWLLQTRDTDEALGWAKKLPFREATVEVRRVAELEDHKDLMTEEQVAREERLRKELEGRE